MTYPATDPVACLVVVQTAVSIPTQKQPSSIPTQKEPFGLEESIHGVYSPETDIGEWKIDTALLSTQGGTVVLLHSSKNSEEDTDSLVPQEVLDEYDPVTTEPSEDESFVLIQYDKKMFVGSVDEARFVVYRVEDGKIIPIENRQRVQVVIWGQENRLVYVYKNNIYYLSQPDAKPVQVTTDGKFNVIYNGILVNYGETGSTLQWSPDGTRIVFERYNASAVSMTEFVYYDAPEGGKNMYTRLLKYHYVKPGTPIAEAQLKVAILPTKESAKVTIRELLPPAELVGHDRYIGDINWIDDTNLMAAWKNRVQNTTQIVSYDTSKKFKRIHGKKGLKLERKYGWVDYKSFMLGYRNQSTYLMIDWESQGEAGSFPHVVKVTNTYRTRITFGEFTVTEIYGWDDDVVYFQATEPGQPSHRHVYSMQEEGTKRCLSCGVITPEGNSCTQASAKFIEEFTWMILTCHGPDPPVISFHYTGNVTGSSVILQDNSHLRELLSNKQWPRRLDDWVDLGNGMRAQVRLWLPPGLDPEGSEKRPAIVNVYAAPDTQQVDDSFEVNDLNYFTTSRRYIYIQIDGRGSGCKGDKMLFSIYRRLGTVEIQDQIHVTKQLTEKYHFIDSSRIAIWGWSHGGFSAAMAMARDDDKVFRCGVAVAPVTNWRIDSAVYIERYMGLPTPEDNDGGYNDTDITRLADHFSNNTFLLIHGSADDNVLYQNSMMLSHALEKAGVLFRQQIYPDEDHSIPGLDTHVYTTIDAFFLECFGEQSLSLQTTQL